MTVFEASIKLYEWFSSSDSFSTKKDSEILLKKKPISEEELTAINCALLELKDLGLISTPSLDNPRVWILKKSLANFEQTIKLSPETCISMTQIINSFCNVVKNETDLADAKSIEEKDIKTLVGICATLIELQTKNENK